jgi:hypothetical protein
VQRVLSTATLLGLLVATSAAFAVTERLKLVKSPVYGTFVSKTLSPVCGCARGKATIRFKLRQRDDVTLEIVDARRRVVAVLAADRPEPRGRVRFEWRGRTDAGRRAPDGVYQPQIHLARQRRTILMPNRIVLDTKPPRVLAARVSRPTISPDGDRVGDSVKIEYRLSEPAHVLVYLGEQLVIRGRFQKPRDSVAWYGVLEGRPLQPGAYPLEVGAVDLAGNQTPVAKRVRLTVIVRYLAVAPKRLRVRPGARFAVRVETDAREVEWTFAGRHGVARKRVLKLAAPSKPGTYGLVLSERGHTTRATVVVAGA